MAWVIDTCVLIDVRFNDPVWALRSAACLNARRLEGLMVSPVTFVELAPSFGGDLTLQLNFLRRYGIAYQEPWLHIDTEAAFNLWNDWIQRKRQGHARKRPIADVLIAAFAGRQQGLITRNTADFVLINPRLMLVSP